MNGQSYKLNLSTGLSNSKNKILFINPLSHSPLVLFSVTKFKFPPNKNGNILVLCIYLEREREKKRTIFQNFVLIALIKSLCLFQKTRLFLLFLLRYQFQLIIFLA